jgi:hypothetical protein
MCQIAKEQVVGSIVLHASFIIDCDRTSGEFVAIGSPRNAGDIARSTVEVSSWAQSIENMVLQFI